MRNIYIGFVVFLILSIAMFITSFVYLDKSRHETYYYNVLFNGKAAGTIKVDRFVTEDGIIYKSESETPFYPIYTECRSRLDLSRKYRLESFSREQTAGRAQKSVYIENNSGLVSFMSTFGSGFSFADAIPVGKDVFIFEDDSPMTYLPVIENYDFSLGRSQGFNALTFPPHPDEPWDTIDGLPPMKRFVTLTSIKDEYLKVDSRKIKTENLLLKIRNYPTGAVWVAKSDRAIIKIELPAKGITIARSFKPRELAAKRLSLQDPRYLSEEVVFKSKDADLTGTLTVPTKEGRFPGVLLLGGGGPSDRDGQGLFISIADYLSKSGFCVLRYDRRGTGSSKADASSATDADEIADASAALDYLRSRANVDPAKIAVAGYGRGAYYAAAITSGSDKVAALVLMAPLFETDAWQEAVLKNTSRMSSSFSWPEEYAQLVIRAFTATFDKANTLKGDWTSIQGKRVFLKAKREEMAGIPAGAFENIKAPVYTIYGDKDDRSVQETADYIEKNLEAHGNKLHAVKAFGYLGRFFGKLVNDGTQKIWYDPDKAVMENIKGWLDKVFSGTPAMPQNDRKSEDMPRNAAPAD